MHSFNLQFVKQMEKMLQAAKNQMNDICLLCQKSPSGIPNSQLMSQFTLKCLGGLPIRYVYGQKHSMEINDMATTKEHSNELRNIS